MEVLGGVVGVIEEFMGGRWERIEGGVRVRGMKEGVNWVGEEGMLGEVMGRMRNMLEVGEMGMRGGGGKGGMGKMLEGGLLVWGW